MPAGEPKTYWTQDEDVQLATGFVLGKSDAELAEELGRTPHAVQSRRARLGLGRRVYRTWSKVEEDWLKTHYAGWSLSYCVDQLGHPAGAIEHKARDLGLAPNLKGWTAAEDYTAIQMDRQGYTSEQIAAQLGRTLSAVRRRLGELHKDV